MSTRCNGCGRDGATETFRCIWPDRLVTLDRHCIECQRTWHAQLRALGARLEPVTALRLDLGAAALLDAPRPVDALA